jgi:hypothetical protein
MVPIVERVASVIPASVIILVRPNNSGPNILGPRINIFTAPNANPIYIRIEDRMLCCLIKPIQFNLTANKFAKVN